MLKKMQLVGDPHLKRDNLAESMPLLSRIRLLAPDRSTLIMGDLYNDHGVIPASVQRVVKDFFDSMYLFDVSCLEGNHDVANDQVNSSLYAHSDQVTIINKCHQDGDHFAYLPFYRNPDDFITAVKSLKLPQLGILNVFCHQEFNGAQFETGFYAPHGVDPNQFDPRIKFISGHIHNGQEFGNVWYIGAPRWLTKGDANQLRGLWLVDFDEQTGEIVTREFVSSGDICPAYHSIVLTDSDINNNKLPKYKDTDKVYVEYLGSDPAIVKSIQQMYRNLSLKHKKPQAVSQTVVGESKGIRASISDYVQSLNINGDKRAILETIFRRLE
jgi:hypothetical protein